MLIADNKSMKPKFYSTSFYIVFACAVIMSFTGAWMACAKTQTSQHQTPYVLKSNAVASFYAEQYHGRKTSNGETFNMNDMTAAHKTLPFGTIVKVTNLSNGKSVQVRINDRGPFVAGREIDLSKEAARRLDMIGSGTANVRLTVVKLPDENTYRYQFGSYNSKENASVLARQLKNKGFDVKYEIAKNSSGNSIVRVVIPYVPESSRSELEQRLKATGYTNFVVRTEKN